MQRALPRCRAIYYPEEGHVSVMHRHSRALLQALREA